MNLKERVQTQDVKTLDLEQKNNKLMKLESENKLLKIDNLKLNKENNILKSKYEEMANEKKEYEIKIRNAAKDVILNLELSKEYEFHDNNNNEINNINYKKENKMSDLFDIPDFQKEKDIENNKFKK